MDIRPTGGRLIALDVFRGLSVAGMILVNATEPGREIYAQLAHAAWNGCTFADWIFPFFLVAVGISIQLSLSKRIAAGVPRARLFWKIAGRACAIYIVGVLMHGFPSYSWDRIIEPLVLKQIATCYFIAASITLLLAPRWRFGVTVAFIAVYWGLMEFFPVPGVGSGMYEPGRNFAAYVERLLFPGGHWADPAIVGTLTATATTLLGVWAGRMILQETDPTRRAVLLLGVGNTLLLAGFLIDPLMPINKKLWTVSYVFFTGGWAYIVLGMFIWIIEILRAQWWTRPFVVFGSNALVVYVASGVVGRLLHVIRAPGSQGSSWSLNEAIYQTCFVSLFPGKLATLMFNLLILASMYLLAWILWNRRIFIRA